MAGSGLRGAAVVVAGLLVLAPVGCSGGEDENLASALLELEDIPADGWATQPPGDHDPAIDDSTGGVCAIEFTDIMSDEVQASELRREFTNEAQVSMLEEDVWSSSSADDVVKAIADELAACSGEYEGAEGDTTVVVRSEPLKLTVPRASESVCRTFTAMVNQHPAYGVVCVASADDRILGFWLLTADPDSGTDLEDYVVLLSAAARKAFPE